MDILKHRYAKGEIDKTELKLPAASCGERSNSKNNLLLLKKFVNFIRSLTPQQAARNALAVQFKEKVKDLER